jgi:hypothetical protein
MRERFIARLFRFREKLLRGFGKRSDLQARTRLKLFEGTFEKRCAARRTLHEEENVSRGLDTYYDSTSSMSL